MAQFCLLELVHYSGIGYFFAMKKLLNHLAALPENGRFQTYTYQRILGGANKILYKVVGQEGAFAVKFTLY